MVVGTIDLETAFKKGRRKLDPGLLGRANRGVVYIDEVNLLPAHLMALILDAAQTGLIRVEREGLSRVHPARFCLIGSMNPEEGGLSPQLLDRFGLCVDVTAETNARHRREILKRRLDFEADPAGFVQRWQDGQKAVARAIQKAGRRLPGLRPADNVMKYVSALSVADNVAGHRADLTLARAARAWAALSGRDEFGPRDVDRVAPMVLGHRRRVENDRAAVKQRLEAGTGQAGPPPVNDRRPDSPAEVNAHGDGAGHVIERLFLPGQEFVLETADAGHEKTAKNQPGRRKGRVSNRNRGRYVRSSSRRLGRSLALDATLRAAAPHQSRRRAGASRAGPILRSWDVREKVKQEKAGRLVIFLVDASGSMGALTRMSQAKAAVMALLKDAYRRRDRVGLVSFRDQKAEVMLAPTASAELAARRLIELPTGGRTPLAHGLLTAFGLARREMASDPRLTPLIVIMTDGKPNVPLRPGDPWQEVTAIARKLAENPNLRFAVVDTDLASHLDFGLCVSLARRLGGYYVKLDSLRHTTLVDLVNTLGD